MNMYKASVKEVITILQSDCENGLKLEYIDQLQKEYGFNELSFAKKVSWKTVFLNQLSNPLMLLLLIAFITSALLAQYGDAVVIALTSLTNVFIGFFQELKAKGSAFKALSHDKNSVSCIREGKRQKVEARYLVPGDIVELSMGSRVPADIRLFQANTCAVNESILTGESISVIKTVKQDSQEDFFNEYDDTVFAGSTVVGGTAKGVVIAIGQSTYLSSIARLVLTAEDEQTPLQKQLEEFSWSIGYMLLVVIGIVSLLGFARGLSLKETVVAAIALSVAAIPEGFVVAVTLALTLGMQYILRRNGLVKKLSSVETLGSVSIICTDKTGTLTKGTFSVAQALEYARQTHPFASPYDPLQSLVVAGVLNNTAVYYANEERYLGDPIDRALLEYAQQKGFSIDHLREEFRKVQEIPFSNIAKYMASLYIRGSDHWLIIKGAPESIQPLCSSADEQKALQAYTRDLVEKGLRVIAFAYKKVPSASLSEEFNDLSFLGVIGFQDVVRPEVALTMKSIKQAGIQVVILTGDHAQTALTLAQNIGIEASRENVVIGEDLKSDKELLKKKLPTTSIFARVNPMDKINIIDAWKSSGAIVAMVGDGVNDGPALKAANIGISLGEGTDVSKETSDIVLLDNNIATLIDIIRIGRVTYENIRKIIVYLMVGSFSEVILTFLSLIFYLPLPLSPAHILWINLIHHGFPHIGLAFEKNGKDVMKKKPRDSNEPLVNSEMKAIIFGVSIAHDIVLFMGYWLMLAYNGDHLYARTLIFAYLSMSPLVYVFSLRSFTVPIWKLNFFENKWLLGSVSVCISLVMLVFFVPFFKKIFSVADLSWYNFLILFLLTFSKVFGIEIIKKIFREKRKQNFNL